MTTHKTSDGSEGGFYIVNPRGVIHECTRDHATEKFQQAGWRMATEAEVATYHAVHKRLTRQQRVKGKLEEVDTPGPGQSLDSPIAEPHSSDSGAIQRAQAEVAEAEPEPDASDSTIIKLATPAALKLARAEGIDIVGMTGSGKAGRVLVDDVEDVMDEQS